MLNMLSCRKSFFRLKSLFIYKRYTSMDFFDTHAHIGLIHEDQIEQLLIIKQAQRAQVKHLVSICNSLSDFDRVYSNLKTAKNVFHAVGVSPSEVTNPGHDWDMQVTQKASLDRIVAIGEIGLDYFRKFGNKKSQIELFIQQLDIAKELELPVIIHNREAGSDVLSILQDRLPPKGGILHCYSENWEYAKKALDMNLYISFAGNVTYRNARNLHETVVNMPLDRMLIESESPFMVPSAYQGKRNKPAYLPKVAEGIAELRDMSVEELAPMLFENSLRAFHLPPSHE